MLKYQRFFNVYFLLLHLCPIINKHLNLTNECFYFIKRLFLFKFDFFYLFYKFKKVYYAIIILLKL